MTYHYATGLLLPKLTLKILILCISCTTLFAQVRPRGLDAYKNWQVQPENITPLRIGDELPDALWHLPLAVVNHPNGKGTVTLREYKGKLILLDFWATWCSSCIAAFPKLDSLQARFADDLQVLLTTDQPAKTVTDYFNRRVPKQNRYSLVDAGLLPHFFTYRTVPHYVWIDADGRLAATTDALQLTAPNVERALAGDFTGFAMKLDLDPMRPFFLAETLDTLPERYTLLHKGHYPGLNSQVREHRRDDRPTGRSFSNYSLLDLYRVVARPLLSRAGVPTNRHRVTVQLADSADWLGTQQTLARDPSAVYSFEYITAPTDAIQLDSLVLDALNAATGFTGTLVYDSEPHLRITETNTTKTEKR